MAIGLNKTILIADDDQFQLDIYRHIFELKMDKENLQKEYDTHFLKTEHIYWMLLKSSMPPIRGFRFAS